MNNLLITQVTTLNTPTINQTQTTPQRRPLPEMQVERLEKVSGVNPMEKPSKMLLSLLRTALSDEKPDLEPLKGANHYDWLKMIEIADEASVSAMASDAFAKLPKGTIPTTVIMNLSQSKEEIEQHHANQERILGAFSDRLSKKGIETIQLKGIGLSMDYPVPTHRFGGDIDIFTRFKGTTTTERSNSYQIVDDMIVADGVKVDDYNLPNYKHSEFMQDGVRMENHKFFVNKDRLREAKQIDAYLHKHINPVKKVLPNGTEILVPSKEFNTVFLSQHAFQHFIFGGIDMHHMTDWAMHLKANGLQFPEELKGTRLEKFTYAFTNLTNKYLGTNVEAPHDSQYEEKIFNKLVNARMEDTPKGLSKPEIIWFKTKRLARNVQHAKQYGGQGFVKIFLKRALEKLKDPSVMFR